MVAKLIRIPLPFTLRIDYEFNETLLSAFDF